LNSSLAQSSVELRLANDWPETDNDTFCATFLFLSKIGFFSHNYVSRYAGKLIKGAKDANFSPVSKKYEPKDGTLGWRPGPDKVGQKFENTPTCDVPHRRPQTQN